MYAQEYLTVARACLLWAVSVGDISMPTVARKIRQRQADVSLLKMPLLKTLLVYFFPRLSIHSSHQTMPMVPPINAPKMHPNVKENIALLMDRICHSSREGLLQDSFPNDALLHRLNC